MYQYNEEEFTFDNDFDERSSSEVGPDEFSTVEEIEVEDGESVILGLGSSRNPLQAEGSAAGDIQDDADADIDGKFRFVVLNAQNNVVARLAQGSINTLEQTRANTLDGYVFKQSNTEVREPYKVGFQLRTASGIQTYSSSNSSLKVDGLRGEEVN